MRSKFIVVDQSCRFGVEGILKKSYFKTIISYLKAVAEHPKE